jgi:hypothetical protein
MSEDSEEQSITRYTLVHFASGYIARRLGVPLAIWITIHIIFELWENSKSGVAFFDSISMYTGDSLQNSLLDTLATVWGWMIANFQAKS